MVQLVSAMVGWHDNLIKQIEGGRPFASACAFAGVPAARVFNEMDMHPEFKKRVEAAKAYGRGEGGEGSENGGVASGVRVAPIA